MTRSKDHTVLDIHKDVLLQFNELRAREASRRHEAITQDTFTRFLLSLYRVTENKDVFDAAWQDMENIEG